MKTFSQLIKEWAPTSLAANPYMKHSGRVMHRKTGEKGNVLRTQPTHVLVDYGNGKSEWHRNDEVKPIAPLGISPKKFGRAPSVN